MSFDEGGNDNYSNQLVSQIMEAQQAHETDVCLESLPAGYLEATHPDEDSPWMALDVPSFDTHVIRNESSKDSMAEELNQLDQGIAEDMANVVNVNTEEGENWNAAIEKQQSFVQTKMSDICDIPRAQAKSSELVNRVRALHSGAQVKSSELKSSKKSKKKARRSKRKSSDHLRAENVAKRFYRVTLKQMVDRIHGMVRLKRMGWTKQNISKMSPEQKILYSKISSNVHRPFRVSRQLTLIQLNVCIFALLLDWKQNARAANQKPEVAISPNDFKRFGVAPTETKNEQEDKEQKRAQFFADKASRQAAEGNLPGISAPRDLYQTKPRKNDYFKRQSKSVFLSATSTAMSPSMAPAISPSLEGDLLTPYKSSKSDLPPSLSPSLSPIAQSISPAITQPISPPMAQPMSPPMAPSNKHAHLKERRRSLSFNHRFDFCRCLVHRIPALTPFRHRTSHQIMFQKSILITLIHYCHYPRYRRSEVTGFSFSSLLSPQLFGLSAHDRCL